MADDQRYSCQECPRDDLSLTKNGRLRSHAANGKKATADNPACGGGSNFPVESTEYHTHVFEYVEDGMGNSGSVCTVKECGMVEREDACTHPNGYGPNGCAGCGAFAPPEDDGLAAQTPGDASSLAGWVDDSDPAAAMLESLGEDPATAAASGEPVVTLEPGMANYDDQKPTAGQYREASAIMRDPVVGADHQWAQDVLERAVKNGVRADDPDGVCTCPGKKKGADDAHNAACVRFVPRTVTATGGPNRHRAPLPTGAPAAAGRPEAASPPKSAAASQSAEDFLGGAPSAPQTPSDDAAAFLAEEEPETEEPLRYFPARYDGSCGSCGERFLEGDNIARDPDGSGDWIAEECCGEALEAESEGPPPARYYDPLIRLKAKLVVRNGRYEAPHPETGKKAKFTRTTTFVKLASDSFALSQWSQRMAVLGLVHRPELGRKVRTMLENTEEPPYVLAKTERERLNSLVDDAKEAAGHKVRAAKGTILHTHTEKLDRGEQQPGEIPEEFRRDAVAYLDAVDRFGLKSHAHLVERSTVVAELDVIGTFDRDYEITKRITAQLPGKGKTPGRTVTLEPGEFVVGDVKSGADLQYSQMEISTQISVYAKGQNRHGIATPVVREDGKGYDWTWRKPGESAMDGTDWVVPEVREDVGIVVHIPYGEHTATVYLVDLEEGWDNARTCLKVQERQRRKKVFTALPLSAVEGAPDRDTSMPTAAQLSTGHPSVTGRINGASVRPAVTTWAQRFAATASRAELKAVAVEADKAGMPRDVLEAFLWEEMKRFPEETEQRPEPTWAERFAAVRTAPELAELAKVAAASGMPGERLGALTKNALGRLEKAAAPAPAPTWAERFAATSTLDDLKDVCRQAVDAGMPSDRVRAYWVRESDRIEIPF